MKKLYYFRSVDGDFLDVEDELQFLYSELFSLQTLYKVALNQDFPDPIMSHMEVILNTVVDCCNEFLISFHYLSIPDGACDFLATENAVAPSKICVENDS